MYNFRNLAVARGALDFTWRLCKRRVSLRKNRKRPFLRATRWRRVLYCELWQTNDASLAALSVVAGTMVFVFILFPESLKIKEEEQKSYISSEWPWLKLRLLLSHEGKTARKSGY